MRQIRELESTEIHLEQAGHRIWNLEFAPTEMYFDPAGCQQVHEGYDPSLIWGVFKAGIRITLAWNKRNGIR